MNGPHPDGPHPDGPHRDGPGARLTLDRDGPGARLTLDRDGPGARLTLDRNGVSVVVPTVGRPSLVAALAALGEQLPDAADWPVELLIVDDRPAPAQPLPVPVPAALEPCTTVLSGPARGPAAARNTGWRAARHPWVAFLDDDVIPDPGWLAALRADLTVPGEVGGVQGRIRVPLPQGRRPTDWERSTAGLARGEWITADMAYRRAVLDATGGFDERFPRAFREDAELAYRVRAAGWTLTRGQRRTTHPVRPEGLWVSLRTQRGNADDALLRRLYGRRWRTRLGVPAGRRRQHVMVTVAGVVACGAVAGALAVPPARRRPWRVAAALGAAGWLAGTSEFAASRIAPGPRTGREVATMLATSMLIPPLAVAHWLRGWCLVHRGCLSRARSRPIHRGMMMFTSRQVGQSLRRAR